MLIASTRTGDSHSRRAVRAYRVGTDGVLETLQPDQREPPLFRLFKEPMRREDASHPRVASALRFEQYEIERDQQRCADQDGVCLASTILGLWAQYACQAAEAVARKKRRQTVQHVINQRSWC